MLIANHIVGIYLITMDCFPIQLSIFCRMHLTMIKMNSILMIWLDLEMVFNIYSYEKPFCEKLNRNQKRMWF